MRICKSVQLAVEMRIEFSIRSAVLVYDHRIAKIAALRLFMYKIFFQVFFVVCFVLIKEPALCGSNYWWETIATACRATIESLVAHIGECFTCATSIWIWQCAVFASDCGWW